MLKPIEKMTLIIRQTKANQKEQIHFKTENLKQYFPKSFTTEQMENAIIKMLEENK